MAIKKDQLIEYVIKPTLEAFNLYSEDAEALMLATCAQETHLGAYLHQVKGPAMGIYQMEPATYEDVLLQVVLGSKVKWQSKIKDYFGFEAKLEYLDKILYDLRYATLFARLQYWRYPEQLPDKADKNGIFQYWKKYYNRNNEKGSKDQFLENYERFVKDG